MDHPPILHHYDFSNYSEKIRLIFGHKRLAWRGVTIPAYAPKPLYTPLTGGYRRTPALQIGADVYCDTRLIAETLEALTPSPTLYPGAQRQHSRALTDTLSSWCETSLQRPLALYITGLHAAEFSPEFHADRARLHGKPQPTLAQVQASAAKYKATVMTQLGWIEGLLSEGQDYLLGGAPGLVDFTLYQAPWFLRQIGGAAALPAGLPLLRAWAERVRAIGHGEHTAITAAAALAEASAADPRSSTHGVIANDEGLVAGARVSVTPLGEQSPATGELVQLSAATITILSSNAECGRLHVHFPRFGYRLRRLADR